MNRKLADLRKEYGMSGINFSEIPENPLEQLRTWINDALDSEITEPNAMILSTLGESDRISSRTVLLKGIIEEGIVFYTNYDSRKAKEIEKHPQVSLTFLWADIERQIRIEGKAVKASIEMSDQYFQSRPRSSQLGAWASPQSKKVTGREELNRRYLEYEKKFQTKDIPRPANWGGYVVQPDYVEFWQGRQGRMHDRLVYEWTKKQWDVYRLAP